MQVTSRTRQSSETITRRHAPCSRFARCTGRAVGRRSTDFETFAKKMNPPLIDGKSMAVFIYDTTGGECGGSAVFIWDGPVSRARNYT